MQSWAEDGKRERVPRVVRTSTQPVLDALPMAHKESVNVCDTKWGRFSDPAQRDHGDHPVPLSGIVDTTGTLTRS